MAADGTLDIGGALHDAALTLAGAANRRTNPMLTVDADNKARRVLLSGLANRTLADLQAGGVIRGFLYVAPVKKSRKQAWSVDLPGGRRMRFEGRREVEAARATST